MAEKYQLLYFNKRGGGEIIRLVFVTAGVQYEDIRLDMAEWLKLKSGLYTDNEDDNLLIDEMYDSVGDVRNVFVQVQLCKDEATKKDLNEKLLTEMLPKFASFFKLRKNDFGGNGYIIGSKMTLADLAVFNMVDSCIEMGLESLWKPYPLLLEHRQNVIKDTNIAKWLQTRPRTEV
ncbi:S-crystallin SL11-like isoform X2 [Mercenaria mercenaria]|uniref:S-crystallin SL11-like isoform X2 n=1 Tax=Mercenaria mercenaria TaxID=6596 RepID=UPI00234E9CF5|nr:S-crystallin SL11-like isoform X2 [Mercenaria mercenaria]